MMTVTMTYRITCDACAKTASFGQSETESIYTAGGWIQIEPYELKGVPYHACSSPCFHRVIAENGLHSYKLDIRGRVERPPT